MLVWCWPGQGARRTLAGQPSPGFLPGPVLRSEMSSASSEPGDGDAQQTPLGLDTVIQVSGVPALQHPPGSRLEGTLGGARRGHTSPAPRGTWVLTRSA